MNYYSDNSNMQNPNPGAQDNKPIDGGLPAASRMCGFLSMTLGMFSITACCLSYLCIPLGALGILFAILSRRQGEKMPPACLAGLRLSITGIVTGIAIFAVTIYTTVTNPLFWEQTQKTQEEYEKLYEEYEKMYEEMYGTELEDYNYFSF